MAGIQGSALCVAVSDAGGPGGSLPCAMLSPEALRAELGAIRQATARPYNLNFFSHTPPVPDPAREAAWRRLLQPYFQSLGIDPQSLPGTRP
jgi:nitronate monooxygenase